MAFGFRVTSDAGVTTDSDFAGYSLVEERSVLVRNQINTTVNFGATITSQQPPIIAFKMLPTTNPWVVICKVLGSAGNWTGFLVQGSIIQAAGNRTYDVRVYATGVKSSDSMGARIRDEGGVITLDSGFKQLEFKYSVVSPQGWPNVIEVNVPAAAVKIVGYASPIRMTGDDLWIPLSLVCNAYVTTMESNYSGRWGTYVMSVFTSFINYEGYLTIIHMLQSSSLPLVYNINFNTFCPLIEN